MINKALSRYVLLTDSDLFDLDIREGVQRTFADDAEGFAAKHFDSIDDYRLWKWFNGLDREGLGVDTSENYGGYDE